MKYRLLELVACPVCRGTLVRSEVEWEVGDTEELIEGELCCDKGHCFPVIDGIPRLLPPELLAETLQRFHPEYCERYKDKIGLFSSGDTELKKKTLASFSYQWNVFSEMYAHWEDNFRSYFEPLVQPDDFAGKRVLDAGCGFGRHAFYAGKYGAEVVAMDLSEAVEAAYKNTRSLPNVHVIQGDIYQPPCRVTFDMVYCVGVIQHLPDPEKGFQSLAALLVEEGDIFVWVYGKRKGLYRLVDAFRRISVCLPMGMLYWLTGGLNLASFLFFSLPYKVLRKLPGARGLAHAWPFTRYADLPLRVGHADWFDRLAVPSTVYFSREEVEGWYKGAGLDEIQLQSRDGIGWRALGRDSQSQPTTSRG